ncbi:Hypothetical predicted protein [Mytilus galloprovincialis]|uniref:B box-type domain-containing protein n=1 Tax=Mytilus galloprovincialis TaxID=29158 RepID=A0A8B6FHJ4_MYTGA|nr:Hypothetical predicted protein [Mytilus galloprovincialis]
MATKEIATFCDICLARDLNKLAEEFCPQCEEVLCGDCRNHHKISKSSKSHQTISIGKYNKLPSFIKQIKHTCEEHDCSLEFYCKSHDSLCCKLCLISGHKECKETIFIEDFLGPSSRHQSAALDNIEKILKNLECNISSAIKDRNRNLTDLREQKQVIAEQIKEKRLKINTVLDNLEETLLKQVSAIENEYGRKIREVIAKLEDEKKNVDEIKEDVDSVKMFGSNLQIFIGTKEYQEKVSNNDINIQMLNDNGSLNNVTMDCVFDEKLERFLKGVKAFGDTKVNNSEKHVSFAWKGDISAQLLKCISRAKSIEHMSVRLVRTININRKGLTGCTMLESGEMFFVKEYTNHLLKYCPDGELHSEIRINPLMSRIGYDLAMVDSNTVALSSSGNLPHKIYLIDTERAETRQVFDINDFSYGLSYHNESFVCCTSNNGIIIFDRSYQNAPNVRILPNVPKKLTKHYVTSNENSVLHSNCNDNSVVSYDFSGQVQWKYSDSMLRKPYGITMDSYSNIYVAGSESNNIVVISKDGKQAKELIGASDGISNPRAIYFHKTKNIILVTNYKGTASLFDVI